MAEICRDNIAALVVAITVKPDVIDTRIEVIHVPNMDVLTDIELLFPFMFYAQMYAFYRDFVLGIALDNLCPTDEVNRVVQGVMIFNLLNNMNN